MEEPEIKYLRPIVDRRAASRRTMWASTWEGCFTQFFIVWTSGSVLTGYFLHLGAGPLALALLASLPQLAQFFNPITALAAPHIRRRRLYLTVLAAIGRGIWLVPFFLPLLMGPGRGILLIALGVVAISSILQNSAGLVWVSLMADNVPEDIRGRYFGFRVAVVGLVGMVANFASGWFLDRVAAPVSFQMVFLAACLFALIGVWMYRWYTEIDVRPAAQPWRDTLAAPLRDANFKRFLVFSAYWQGAVMIAAPFVIPYFLQELHLTYMQVAVWTAISSTASLLTCPMWGRIADFAGHKTVLMITTILAGTLHPLCWMLARPGHLTFIWISGVIDAFAWGGINTAMFNLAIGTTPARLRVSYLAVLNLLSGFVGFVMGLVSGPLITFLARYEFYVFDFHWTGYHSLFAITGVLRSQAWRLLRHVHEPRAWSTWQLLRLMAERGFAYLVRPFGRETT